MKETEEYRTFTKPAELHKAMNTLKGIVAGITMEAGANENEIKELLNWCVLHKHFIDRHPFCELIPMIESAQDDGVISVDEAHDILWLCNNFSPTATYYDVTTSTIQHLLGLLHGILADGELSDREVHVLREWMDAHDFLKGSYPFDEIDSIITAACADGRIDDDERQQLKAFFSNFIDLSMSYNLNEIELHNLKSQFSISGICAVQPEIIFKNRLFCFTGTSHRAKRSEIESVIISKGGLFNNSVVKNTDYLIVGNAGNPCWAYSCYGRKVEEAVDMRKRGLPIVIVNETDFWDEV